MYFWTCYPLGLDLPLKRRPLLTAILVGVMALAFVWSRWFPDLTMTRPWDLVFYAGVSRPWTVVSALFLHADWFHLVGNLAYLVAFLPALEDRLGRSGLLMLFLATGIGGNLCHGLASWSGWMGQSGMGILGASGAISGLLGYALLRLPHARIRVAYWVFAPLQGQNRAGKTSLPLPVAVLAWLVLQIVNALLVGESGSTVSYPAHLGGFTGGLVMGLLLGGRGEGKTESRLLTARRHLEAGEGWPAVGAFTEYLEAVPSDLDARVELARSYLLADVRERALETYQRAYSQAAAGGRWDRALAVLGEAGRLEPGLGLRVDDLGQAAQQADRAGHHELAVALYQVLVRRPGRHPVIERAWVRLVLLLQADPQRQHDAAAWLERAAREMPPGAWRTYLEREFRVSAAPGAAPPPGPTGVPPERGS